MLDDLAHSVFSSNLIAVWKVVHLLMLVDILEHEVFGGLIHPHHVPFMALCACEAIFSEGLSDELSLAFKKFETETFIIFDLRCEGKQVS